MGDNGDGKRGREEGEGEVTHRDTERQKRRSKEEGGQRQRIFIKII